MITIELAVTPVVCLVCGKKLREFASTDVGDPGESSGCCPECEPELRRRMGVA
jgi:hypothetical protein